MKSISIVLLCICLLSCGEKQTAKAVIFERKVASGGRLTISYMFEYRGTTIIDSAIVDNRVLRSDTLNVIFPKHDPMKSTPEMQVR